MLELTNDHQAGVDEAGRGPLFGPVVAAAVVLPTTFPDQMYMEIKDSKKLSAKKRERLADYIERVAVTFGIGIASPAEVDEINILQATYAAMHRALNNAFARHPFDSVLVDGPAFKPYLNTGFEEGWIPHHCVLDGDNIYMNIAAASILAKTHHDRLIDAALAADPSLKRYGLGTNKGYGTKQHMQALRDFGPAAGHRITFGGVVV